MRIPPNAVALIELENYNLKFFKIYIKFIFKKCEGENQLIYTVRTHSLIVQESSYVNPSGTE